MISVETRTMGKVSARLIPFLIVCYFIAYLDRVNVGFASLTMNKDLGLDPAMFGFGSGVFFLSYFLFEVPSNLALNKFGARKWIARIMITWGVLSGAMAFIPHISDATGLSREYTFYAVRVLLGFAEAGFFPGIIFYLTLWFPALYKARMIGYFMAAIPLSSAIGSPISAQVMTHFDGLVGFTGWQWLFIIEAIPAIVLSVVVYFYLTDRPADAHWLAADERSWLSSRLAAEERQRMQAEHFSIGKALGDPRVLALAFVYFGAVACNYGVGFWLPTIVKGFGLSTEMNGWVTAIPYVIGTVAMIAWGRSSDHFHERKGHAAVALLLAAIGIGGSTAFDDPTTKMALLSLGACGVFGVLPVFWTLPTAFLSGSAAAAGIAIINALGNLSGFAGPYAMGWINRATGSFTYGLLLIAGLSALAMVVALSLGHNKALETVPGPAAYPAE